MYIHYITIVTEILHILNDVVIINIQCALDIPALDTPANALYRHISE